MLPWIKLQRKQVIKQMSQLSLGKLKILKQNIIRTIQL